MDKLDELQNRIPELVRLPKTRIGIEGDEEAKEHVMNLEKKRSQNEKEAQTMVLQFHNHFLEE